MNPVKFPAAMLEPARAFMRATVSYTFTEREKKALSGFFTNFNGKVFFIHTLPTTLITTLLSMYSRIKNPRGIRGHWVDNLLPLILLGISERYKAVPLDEGELKKQVKDMESFLKENNLKSLDSFCGFSAEHQMLFVKFIELCSHDQNFLGEIASSPKIRHFLGIFLDKFGHNSIARPAQFVFGVEGVSILAAKSLEWSRPGSGFIELSTRFVEMSHSELYPFWDEMGVIGGPIALKAKNCAESAFDTYCAMMHDESETSFPAFLGKKYNRITSPSDLEKGISGEVCDVLGNLLPCATLTSLGVSVSGEELPMLLKHLWLDETPENYALAELITEEGEKIGAGQFLRHLDISPWERNSWEYLDARRFIFDDYRKSNKGFIGSKMLQWIGDSRSDALRKIAIGLYDRKDGEANFLSSGENAIRKLLKVERGKFDKLPNQFESISGFFRGIMSMRGWRDLHRQGLCTHFRTLVTPSIGFYLYDKPAPRWLHEMFAKIHKTNEKLYKLMVEKEYPPEMMQYPMAMGNVVGFQVGGNLLQWEFVGWQRTKFSVNHEVRNVVLNGEHLLRDAYPWWENLSRADIIPGYVFARTAKGIPMHV